MKGINVQKSKVGDVVEVTTEHHTYTFKVLSIFDAKKPMVRIISSNNTKPTLAEKDYRLEGSSPEEALLPVQIGLIVIGQRLLFTPLLWLSPTVSVAINGIQVLPKK